MKYDQSLRARGGVGFASSMFRFTAEPKNYSKRLGDELIAKMNLSESVKFYDLETFFILTLNDKPVIIKDYDFVELKRQTSGYAFEEWLENTIKDLIS